jgi:hypothetical protein
MDNQQTPDTDNERKNRRFAVSANRGGASHRVRYVETGGAAVDTEECTFCQAVPDLEDESLVKATRVTGHPHSSE